MRPSQKSSAAGHWFLEKSVLTREGTSFPYLVIDPASTQPRSLPLSFSFISQPEVHYYLSSEPGGRVTMEDVLVAVINCDLNLDVPENVNEPRIAFLRGHAEILHYPDNRVLGKTNLEKEPSHNVHLRAEIPANLCDSLSHAFQGNDSSLHVRLKVSFYVESIGDVKSMEIVQPFSKLMQLSEVEVKEFYYVFNPETHSFDNAPTTQRFTPDKTRLKEDRGVMVRGNKIGSNIQLMHPVANFSLASVAHSPTVNLTNASLIKLDNVLLQSIKPGLPLVEQIDKLWFKDTQKKHTYWALPSLRLKLPLPDESSANSPFRFIFHKLGLGKDGKPVLEGEILLTIEIHASDSVKQEIKREDTKAKILQVQPSNYKVTLSVPFINENGEVKKSLIDTQEINREGDDIKTTFRLTNEWVKLCYGALSLAGELQGEDVEILVTYEFEGMGKKPLVYTQLLLNAQVMKLSALPITKRAIRNQKTYFNSATRKLVMENGQEIVFNDKEKIPENSGNRRTLASNKLANLNVASLNLLPAVNVSKVDHITADKEYVKRSFLKTDKLVASIPCEQFGSFYLEEDHSGSRESVGCKEPYTLGEVRFRLFSELPGLANSFFRVYQSTQVPNRFLVVPRRYVVTRYEPGVEDAAFTPCLRLYSSIDAEDLDRSLCLLDGTLAPDIPDYEIGKLRHMLSRYSLHAPEIVYPGQTEHEEEFQWSVPGELSQSVESFSLGEFIRFSMSAGIEKTLILHALLEDQGLSGVIQFKMPDDTNFSAVLNVALSTIRGPFIHGALKSESKNGKMSYSNELSFPVVLTLLHEYSAEDHTMEAVERELAPKASHEIATSEGKNYIMEYKEKSTEEKLEETRVYLEDIECQVIFTTGIDFQDAGIDHLEIHYSLPGEEKRVLRLAPDDPVKEGFLLMPLTDFLRERKVEYQIHIKKSGTGDPEIRPLREVSLIEEGNIINITTSLLS
jgi:hypothetical protein